MKQRVRMVKRCIMLLMRFRASTTTSLLLDVDGWRKVSLLELSQRKERRFPQRNEGVIEGT